MKRKTRTTRLGGQRAFTLIEVTIVLLIIAIMTAVAAPRFGESLNSHRVDAAAERIAFDLKLARHHAKMSSASRPVAFNTTTSTYTMTGIPDLDHPSQDYFVDLTRSPYNVFVTYADFNGVATVTFNGFGVPNEAGEIDVEAGDHIRTVVLSSSGEVTVQ